MMTRSGACSRRRVKAWTSNFRCGSGDAAAATAAATPAGATSSSNRRVVVALVHRGRSGCPRAGNRRAPPVVHPAGADPIGLSFWNLVECSVLATIRKQHEISLQKVRRALTYVAKELGKQRPLIEQDFSTDGVHLFVERYGK